MEPTIYILLPIHNRKEITRKFIQCLKQQTFSRFRLIVIDDGSTDGSSEMIREYFPDAAIITGKGKWWWGGSLQQGYKWIKKNVTNTKDIVLIINDDCNFNNDYLEIAVGLMEDKEHTFLLSEAFSMQTGLLIDKGVVLDFSRFTFRMPKENEEINCMSTRGLFMHAEDLIRLKGFRNILLPHYYSDYEFTIRAKKNGYRLTVNDSLKLMMDEKSTGIGIISSNSPGDYLKQYFSKKHTDHPVYTLNFILLAFPFPYNIKFGIRHVVNTLKLFIKLLFRKKAFILF